MLASCESHSQSIRREPVTPWEPAVCASLLLLAQHHVYGRLRALDTHAHAMAVEARADECIAPFSTVAWDAANVGESVGRGAHDAGPFVADAALRIVRAPIGSECGDCALS